MSVQPALCVVQLRNGDELASLAREWGLPGSPAAGAQQICAWNGVAFDRHAIDDWVMGNGGIRLPYDPRDPYDEDTRTGWGVFSSESRILMPVGRRPCVDVVNIDDPLVITARSGLPAWVWWVGGSLGLLALAAATPKKKRKE